MVSMMTREVPRRAWRAGAERGIELRRRRLTRRHGAGAAVAASAAMTQEYAFQHDSQGSQAEVERVRGVQTGCRRDANRATRQCIWTVTSILQRDQLLCGQITVESSAQLITGT